MALWYVPEAVMWHIIPPEKVTDEAFRRLARHIGISQRLRAELRGGVLRARLREVLKWVATVPIGCMLRSAQRGPLWIMRREIARGLFSKSGKNEAPTQK